MPQTNHNRIAVLMLLSLTVLVGTVGCGGTTADNNRPDAAPATTTNDPAIDGRLTINEILAVNVLTDRDESGAAAPWIELYNPTAQDLALEGYGVTDDLNQPRKAVLPAGTALPAGGYLRLWCDGAPSAGADHLGVILSSGGGTIALARPNGSYIDRIVYGAQEVDLSAAREPDGSNNWVIEWLVSPGAANPAGGGQPVAPEQAGGAPETVPAAGDLSDRVLGYDLQPSFGLQISDDGIASLRAAPATWVPATLVYAGRSYGPIAVNLKGTSSFVPIDGGKPEFRVNINKLVKGARFFGLKEFLLNNMTTDGSMMHERMAYWVARQTGAGLPASRSNHAQLTLNGQPLGLYANVEEPKAQLLARFFADATGPIYTVHYADFVPQYLSDFQWDDGPVDPTLITGLTSALGMQPIATAVTAAGAYVNWHMFNRYWAEMVVTGHWGGWPYAPDPEPVGANAGVYGDPTTKQLYFIPEGINDAFTTSSFDFIKEVKSVLPRTCHASPSCFQDFVNQVWEILAELDQLDWAAEHDRVAAQIAPLVTIDTRKPYSDADVTMNQQQMRYFIAGRRQSIGTLIPPAGQ